MFDYAEIGLHCVRLVSTDALLRLCKVSVAYGCREDPKTLCTLGVRDFDIQM